MMSGGGSHMSKVVVIGGGIGGLATAALLAREGHRVTLLERHAEVGGRVGSYERDGFRWDTGPSWYLMPEVFDHFYRLLGTSADEQLDLVQLDPGYRVYAEGSDEPIDVAADPGETLETFERIERGSAKRMAAYLERSKEIYTLARERFLYTTFERLGPVFRGEVATSTGRLLRLLLEPLDRLARRTVRDRRLRQILGYPAVFLGSAPALAPSMYSLMSHLDLVDGVRYPMGGFRQIIRSIERLAEREGVRIVTSAEATRIRVTAGAPTGVEWIDADGLDRVEVADIVVSAADLHHTETKLLHEPELRSYPEEYWSTRTAGPGAVLVLLGVRGELPQLEHHTLFFAKDWAENFAAIFGRPPRVPATPSFYVCKPSGVDPSVAPDGHENLFLLVPMPADPGLGSGGIDGGGSDAVETIADAAIDRMAAWAGIPELRERIVTRRTIGPGDFERDLHAWKGSALGPAHTLRQSAFFRAGNASRRVRGLYYAGSSTIPGIGLPMCLISAELVVKRLRGDTTTTPLPAPLRARSRSAGVPR